MITRFTVKLILILITIGCSENESNPECHLVKIIHHGVGVDTHTQYEYSSDGKVLRQVRTTNGSISFDYAYSYNSEGRVDKVNDIDSYFQFEYNPDGKLLSVTSYSNDGTQFAKHTYEWTLDAIKIIMTKPGFPNPVQSTNLEFDNGNIVKESFTLTSGNEPNELSLESTTSFDNYDNALNPFYIVSLSRPGYSPRFSKNNHGVETNVTTYYSGGTITDENSSTNLFSYSYNKSKAVVTTTLTNNGKIVTTFEYEGCD